MLSQNQYLKSVTNKIFERLEINEFLKNVPEIGEWKRRISLDSFLQMLGSLGNGEQLELK